MQVSMPSASTSTFNRPSAAMSSLSHSMKVRSSIAALPTGTTSTSGPRVKTKPPTCCDRWRGKPISSCASSSTVASSGSVGIEPRRAHMLFRQLAAAGRAPHHAGERCDRILRQPHGLADVAHRRARAIGDDGGGKPGAVAAIARVDVLDHLLAPLVLEVDVDVGRLLAFGRHEAIEQHVDLGGVHRGDGEAIADDGVGGRAAPLAEDVLGAREVDDVAHGEEVLGVAERVDELQLAHDERAHLLGDAVGEAPVGALPGELFQIRLRCLAGRRRLVGVFVDELVEIERARRGDLQRARERFLVAAEQARHLQRPLEMPLGVGFQLEAGLADGRLLAHAGEHVLQRAAVRRVVEHVAGSDERRAATRCQRGERGDARPIIAAIGVARRQVQRRPAQRLLHSPQLLFKTLSLASALSFFSLPP